LTTIRLDDVTKVFEDGTLAVDQLSLETRDGEFLVLLGPSGCGKSTALRMIAGLESITSGDLFLDDRVANDMSPRERNMAMVFQNFALYPYMNVHDNIAFPLRLAKTPREEISERVSVSASRWRGRSCGGRRCSSWTSRCPTWMPGCGSSCGPRSPR
jgi:multiple sugar transport system ATP-binding protein